MRHSKPNIHSPNPSAIEQWKRNMLTLPDERFFEIMRNYLGKLKTPYNKHTLIRDLTAFLQKKETRRRIISLIDEGDAVLLTALYVI
jgi:hypothetical protein